MWRLNLISICIICMRKGCRMGNNKVESFRFKSRCLSSFIPVWLPDNEESEPRTSLTVCQLKDGLEHDFQTGLISVYLKVEVWQWRLPLLVLLGEQLLLLYSFCRQQTQLLLDRDRSDGQQLIKGNPEPGRLALMPQGFVKEGNLSAYRANTHPLFI